MKIPVNNGSGPPVSPAIHCPRCSSNNLQQLQVVAGFAVGDDSSVTRVTTVNKDHTHTLEHALPSAQAIGDCSFISLVCEGCDASSVLRIKHYKGGTHLEWMPPSFEVV